MSSVTMKQLLEAGAHFGHQTRRWNPKMKPYIWGARHGVHIIDLQVTLSRVKEAAGFVKEAVSNGQKVLFVGTKRQAMEAIEQSARVSNQYFVSNRWLGGMMTNFKTIRNSIERLRHIEKVSEDGTAEKMTKKEKLMLSKERVKLEKILSGIKSMKKLPGAVFVVDPNKEKIAVREANKLNIPVIAVVDTNCDPDNVDHLIPANDDAIKSIQLFCQAIAEACEEGNKIYEEKLQKQNKEKEEKEKETKSVKAKKPAATETADFKKSKES